MFKNKGLKFRIFAIVLSVFLLAGIILPFVVAPQPVHANPGGMQQVIVGGYNDALFGAATEYNCLMGGNLWVATENQRYQCIPTGGTISSLFVELSANIAAGATGIFTLMVDGSPSALTCTINAGASVGSDVAHSVAVTVGQTVSIRATYTGTPGTPWARWTTLWEGTTAGESICLASAETITSVSYYWQIQGKGYSATENRTQSPVPTSGTFKKLYVQLSAAPGSGAGDAYTFALRVGGASKNNTVTITQPSTSGNITDVTDVVAAGDLVDLIITPVSTPNASPYVAIGIVFVADTDGESLILGGSAGDTPSTSSAEYLHLCGSGTVSWASDETLRYSLIQACTIKNLYVNLSTAPGAVSAATETLRPNAAGDETSIAYQLGAGSYHWDKVDESTPDEDTTLIYDTSTSYHRDLYNLPAHSVGVGTINSITIYFRIRSDYTDVHIYGKPSQKSGSTVTDGTEVDTNSVTFTTYSQTYTTNPATSAAYTWDEIDALQVGVALKSGTAGGYPGFCTQVYVEVNYTPPAKSYTVSINKDAGAASGLTVTISDTATTGNDTAHTYDPADGDTADIKCVPANTPAATYVNIGLVCYIAGGATAPTVTCSAATSIEDITATLNGNVTNTGGEDPTVTVYWGDNDGGEVAGSWDNNSAPTSPAQPQGVAAFYYNATSLPTGTTIYFNAKATNSGGTDWGATQSFLTKPAAPTNVAATDGVHTDKVVITWTKSTGAINYVVYQDAENVSGTLGDVATYDDTDADAPTITAGSTVATDGSSTAQVELSLSGTSVSNGTTHTYYVVASNATGNSDNSSSDTGYRGHGSLTYQWQRSAADSDADYSNIDGATDSTYNDTAAPAPTITPGSAVATDGSSTAQVDLSLSGESANVGAGRYYKCVLNATGCAQQISASNRGYRGVGALTYQWQRSSGDADSDYSNITGAESSTYNDTNAPAPTITPGSTIATDGSSTTQVELSLSGASANVGAGRYYKCVLNADGASQQTSASNRGYRGVGALTYQWQKSSGDADSDYSNIDGATSSTYNDTAAPAPTITPGTVTATDGDSPSEITLSISGESASNGAGRYYKCVLNATGASQQTSASDRGYRGTTSLTYQWYRSAADSDASYSVLSGATTDPYDDTTAPSPTVTPGTATATDGDSTSYATLSISGESASNGEGRYYYCKVSMTGASDQDTTHDRGYRGTTTLTYQWYRSAADSDADYSVISGGTTDPYNDTAAPAPTITPGTASATDGDHTDKVTLSISGQSANEGAGRYFYCTVSMTGASSQDTTHDRGYRGVGSLSYQWYRSSADSDADYSVLSGAASTPFDDSTAPSPTITPGTAAATDGDSTSYVTLSVSGETTNTFGRYYYCVLSASGASNQDTTHDRGYIGVGAISYQWYRSAGDSDESYSVLSGATADPYNDSTAPAPTITPGTASSTDGSSTSYITLSIDGESANTFGRYYYCTLSATGASNQDTTHNRGYIGAGALTYQWYRSSGDSDTDYSSLGGATTDPYNDSTAPAPTVIPGTASVTDGSANSYTTLSISGASTSVGAGRYYYCIVSATGAVSQDTTHDRGYRGVGSLTYQWYRSSGDSDADYSSLSGATTEPYNDTTAPAPTITPGTASASDGTSYTYVTLDLSGQSTSIGAGRYYYCIVGASGASNQDTTHDRGYRGVGSLTYQWQRSAADSDADYSNISDATTDPYNDTGAPSNGDGRYFKCVENADGAAQQTSTSDRGYRLVCAVPTIATSVCTGFEGTWATLNGVVNATGCGTVTEVGFDYGLTDSYGSSWTITGSFADGQGFIGTIMSLSPATVYHYRAKAYSAAGWGYGSDGTFSTTGSPTLYEEYTAGGDGDSSAIYGVNWTAMQFTTGTLSHTVTRIHLIPKRVGSPGTITIALYHATDGLPTGQVIVSTTFNGNYLSTSYGLYPFEVDETSLSASSQYAIVVSAPLGDGSNYVMWQADSGGGLADAVGSHSTNGGLSWTSDTPKDYLFEIWGNVGFQIIGANVFYGYLDEDDEDMLICIEYENNYPPYANTTDPTHYFQIQLLNTAGDTILAAVPMPAWGYKVASIYIGADLAATLTPNAAYYVSLYGTFTGHPTTQYQLQGLDWRGDNLINLDSWVIDAAYDIQDYYSLTGSDALLQTMTGKGTQLTAAGGGYLCAIGGAGGYYNNPGIPYLILVRPDLFSVQDIDLNWDEGTANLVYGTDTGLEEQVGTEIYGDLLSIGGLVSISAAQAGQIIVYLLIACMFWILMSSGGTIFGGIFVASLLLVVGNHFRVISIQTTLIFSMAMILLFVTNFWWQNR